MKVFVKKPGEKLQYCEIENTLEALQAAVGGYIETVSVICQTLNENGKCIYPGVCVICNEEGRLNGMEYNCEFDGVYYYGPILFVGTFDDEFDDFPLNEGAGRLFLKSMMED